MHPPASLPATCMLLLASAATAQQWQWTLDRALPGDFQAQGAYDEARERVVLFGSESPVYWRPSPHSYTYEWDGQRWMHRFTENGQFLDASLCYDPVRRRIVRVCGANVVQPLDATLEWDGQTWLQRNLAGPIARTAQACTFHAATGRVLLFGGSGPYQTASARDDTWELSGVAWTQLWPTVHPSRRLEHGMVYDPTRQRSVLFGGSDLTQWLRNDTWEWDGTAWSQRQPANVPPPRAGLALAHDPLRGRTVMFGGRDNAGRRNDTWEWDGLDWQQVTTVNRPSPRSGSTMVFDRAAGRMLLFGGRSDGYRYTDTWIYDGIDWRQLHDTAGPAWRSAPMLSHDPLRQRTTLFGGFPVDPRTWETDGYRWWIVLAVPSPLPRYNLHAAFDLWRGRSILFGGRADASSQALLDDTWEWDGASWVRASTVPAPSPREGGCMAFDFGRGVTVLFGGQDFQGVLRDTWEWNGAGWQQRNTANAPASGLGHAMCYDLALGRIVAFVGSHTWHYDGIDWTLMAIAGPSGPSPRVGHALAFHPQRGKTVLFGGTDPNVQVQTNDLWEWDGSQWSPWLVSIRPPPQAGAVLTYDFTNARMILTGGATGFGFPSGTWFLAPAGQAISSSYGDGCPDGTASLRSDAAYLGNTGCSIELGSTPLVPALLAASLAAANIALPGGCTLLLQSPFVTALGVTSPMGVLRFPLPVPLVPALRGATVHFQALVFDGAGPLGGTTLTAGLRVTAGE